MGTLLEVETIEAFTKDELTRKELISAAQSWKITSSETKSEIDRVLRTVLESALTSHWAIDRLTKLYDAAILLANHDLCSPSSAVTLIQDTLDTRTLPECSKIFQYLQKNVKIFKRNEFYQHVKNFLLRMCNDLLKRLSKSQDTEFCGEVMMLLAKLFPLDEKSAVNLNSVFNLENTTDLDSEAETTLSSLSKMDTTEVGEIPENTTPHSAGDIAVDYTLYKDFWGLQKFFSNPTMCYEDSNWKNFTQHTAHVFRTFEDYKLDDSKISRDSDQIDVSINIDSSKEISDLFNRPSLSRSLPKQSYFAKYLTNARLLHLQLSDCNFRRYVYIQFLILFQYLNAHVRSKQQNQTLSEEQRKWVDESAQRVFRLLEETGSDGREFADIVEKILHREDSWSEWKNKNCPSFVRAAVSLSRPMSETFGTGSSKKTRSIGDQIYGKEGKKTLLLGHAEMTRLWNLAPDNNAACKVVNRSVAVHEPKIEEFMAEAIEQLDPEAMVDDEYKLINDPAFQWRALRLMSRKSLHFFSLKEPDMTLDVYLKNMLMEMAKEDKNSFVHRVKTSSPDIKPSVSHKPSDGLEEQTVKKVSKETRKQTKSKKLHETASKRQIDPQISPGGVSEKKKRKSADYTTSAVASPPRLSAGVKIKLQQAVKLLTHKLGSKWRDLAPYLKHGQEDIDYIGTSEDSEGKRAEKMLTLYIENFANDNSLEELQTALSNCGLSDLTSSLNTLWGT